MALATIYALSLHDALPILSSGHAREGCPATGRAVCPGRRTGVDVELRRAARWCDSSGVPVCAGGAGRGGEEDRSEEHTSELQSQSNLVCRLLLEKKNKSAS